MRDPQAPPHDPTDVIVARDLADRVDRCTEAVARLEEARRRNAKRRDGQSDYPIYPESV